MKVKICMSLLFLFLCESRETPQSLCVMTTKNLALKRFWPPQTTGAAPPGGPAPPGVSPHLTFAPSCRAGTSVQGSPLLASLPVPGRPLQPQLDLKHLLPFRLNGSSPLSLFPNFNTVSLHDRKSSRRANRLNENQSMETDNVKKRFSPELRIMQDIIRRPAVVQCDSFNCRKQQTM